MASAILSSSDLRSPAPLEPGTRMSDEELMRFSEQHRPWRFERTKEGEIITMSPVGGLGGIAEGFVYQALSNWNESTGLGIAFPANVGFNLADGACLAPDAAWVPLARWNALTPKQQAGFLPLCPDFLVEVRSSSDSRGELEAKMQQWIENGAQLAWLVDTIDAKVSIYRPNQTTETLERPDLVVAHALLQGFELRTLRLWSQSPVDLS